MIDYNELRIGNLVKKGASRKITVVSQREIETCKRIPNFFNPIPIDVNNVLNLGFHSNPYQDRYELNDIYIEHCAIRNMLWIEKAPHVKYLHQLQNCISDCINL